MRSTILILFISASWALYAQENTFTLEKNKTNSSAPNELSSVQLGYGFLAFAGTLLESTLSATSIDESHSQFGPIYAKYEYMIEDEIGIGINFAYLENQVTYTSLSQSINGNLVSEKAFRRTWSVIFRINYHFARSKKVDPYVGGGFGYRNTAFRYEYPSTPSNNTKYKNNTLFPMGFEATMGVRFYLNDFIGFYAETGLAKSVLQAGASFKF